MNFELENSVNHRIAQLAQLLKRQIFRIMAEEQLDITPDQWVILDCLWHTDMQAMGEIAQRTRKDFANVTRIVDKLERMGYVEKLKSKKDSRSTLVKVSGKSLEIKSRLEESWQRSTGIAVAGIEPNEQQLFLQTLSRIEDNVLAFLEKEN